MATFPSKIDTWLRIVLMGSAAGTFAVGAYMLYEGGSQLVLAAAVVVLVGSALPLWLISSTRYKFTISDLEIRCGPFRWRVPIREIRDVRPTRNPLSSPALSLDRLRIDYGHRSIMISPREKERFLRELEARRSAVT